MSVNTFSFIMLKSFFNCGVPPKDFIFCLFDLTFHVSLGFRLNLGFLVLFMCWRLIGVGGLCRWSFLTLTLIWTVFGDL